MVFGIAVVCEYPLAMLLSRGVNYYTELPEQGFKRDVDDLVLDKKFGHGGANHNHYTTVMQVST